MLLIKLAGHIKQAGAALEDGYGRAILFNVHDGGHAAIRIDGRIPLCFAFAAAHVHVDIIVLNARTTSTSRIYSG